MLINLKRKINYNLMTTNIYETITGITDEYYHYSGRSLRKYWNELFSACEAEEYCFEPLLMNGTMDTNDINNLIEMMLGDAECGAIYNYVNIAKHINVDDEIIKVTEILQEESEEPLDYIDIANAIRAYCHYKIGQYEVFSLQIDSLDSYKHMISGDDDLGPTEFIPDEFIPDEFIPDEFIPDE